MGEDRERQIFARAKFNWVVCFFLFLDDFISTALEICSWIVLEMMSAEAFISIYCPPLLVAIRSRDHRLSFGCKVVYGKEYQYEMVIEHVDLMLSNTLVISANTSSFNFIYTYVWWGKKAIMCACVCGAGSILGQIVDHLALNFVRSYLGSETFFDW